MKKETNADKVVKILRLIDHGGMTVRYGKPVASNKYEMGFGFVEALNGKDFKIKVAMNKDGEPDAKELANAFVQKVLAFDVDETAIRLFRYFRKIKRPVSLSAALVSAKRNSHSFVALAGKVLKAAGAA